MKEFILKNKFLLLIILALTVFCSSTIILYLEGNLNNSSQVLYIDGNEYINESEDEPIKEVKSDSLESSNPIEIKKILTVEIGAELPEISDYFESINSFSSEVEIRYYNNDKEVSISDITETINGILYLTNVSTYKVVITDGEKEYFTQLKVADTTTPEVVLKDITITEGEKYNIKDFLVSYKDNSGDTSHTINYKDNSYSKFTSPGTYKIIITVCDPSKNCVDKSANLVINKFVLKVVNTITQSKVIKTEDIKYGVKRVTSADVTYDVYNDGSKKEVSRSGTKTKIDQSTFNGTTSSMKSEAISLYSSLQPSANTILEITNKYRKEVNEQPLTLDKNLSIIATIRAIEIAYSGKFSHTRPNGSEWHTIWDEYYDKSVNVTRGENLAYGYSSDEGACVGWRESQGHYENMIDPRFSKLGVGKFTFNGQTYWVQLFQS